MVEHELQELILQIQKRKCEEQIIEVKAAEKGCPERLYDTISAFSNQNSGGTIVFGIDEKKGFAKCGVYDAQDLQKKVMEYCEQMTPVVRPVFTVYNEESLSFVSAEIPPVDITERPCFKTGKGRLQGSYTRVGDADKPMTEYEVYSYEAFRKKYRDDIRAVDTVTLSSLDAVSLSEYIAQRKKNRPNLASIPDKQLYELVGITRDENVTLAALLLFGVYPQAHFPQLGVIATCVPGTEQGVLNSDGSRFTDSRRIEGTLTDMLSSCLTFVLHNMRVSTKIDPNTGERSDTPQYPMDAVREAILNAFVHRDYSIHTQGMPIQLIMFSDRIEISSPGGLYGRLTLDELGNTQPDTRNPVLVTAMEFMGQTENRYSGIPRIRHAMKELHLPEPVFSDRRGVFTVTLFNSTQVHEEQRDALQDIKNADTKGLLEFCRKPKTRAQIKQFLGLSSAQYALQRYLEPLVSSGAILLSVPEKPGSPRQTFTTSPDVHK